MANEKLSSASIRMSVLVPREPATVGLVRTLTRCILTNLGAPEGAREELVLAMTEGCENAVEHAPGTDEYEVTARLTETGCELDVCDAGPGLDRETFERLTDADLCDESGRGLAVMRQLTDDLQLIDLDAGTCVRLHKRWALLGPQGQVKVE